MSEASTYTVQQAGDPATPAHVLADIAAQRPDLRPAVARNPAAYPGLLEWLAALGDPAVDVALWSRPGRSSYGAPGSAPEGGTAGEPAAPSSADVPLHPGAGAAFQPPYGAPAPQGPAPYGAPAPQGPSAYGAPGPQGQPGRAPDQAYAAPGQAYGYAAPKKNTGKIVLIVVVALLALVVLAVVGIIVLRGAIEAASPDGDLGSDPDLDTLYAACAAEDWEACDELYFSSPMDSEYEEFGRTCGGRTEGSATCVVEMGELGEPSDGRQTYGDDPALDALWDACEGGDGGACDELFFESPIGSEYEEFGRTCGGRTDGFASCTDEG